MLSLVEQEKSFITSGPGLRLSFYWSDYAAVEADVRFFLRISVHVYA